MAEYELITTSYNEDRNKKEERFPLEAENIVDIKDALRIASKYEELATKYPEVWAAIYGELPPHCGECMQDTLEKMSKVPIPSFNY